MDQLCYLRPARKRSWMPFFGESVKVRGSLVLRLYLWESTEGLCLTSCPRMSDMRRGFCFRQCFRAARLSFTTEA